MEQKGNDEKLMIRYLLGELSEEEQTRLEERFFTDDEYFEHLLAVEDELIDTYVRGELSLHERKQFEKYFLTSPQRRQRVEFARALMRTVSEAPVVEALRSAVARPEPVSWWHSLLASLRPQSLAFRFAMAAVSLLVVGGGAWLIVEMRHLRTQLAQFQAERQALQHREQALLREVIRERERRDELAEQLQREQNERTRLEQELAKQPPSRPTILSYVLPSGFVRGVDEPKRLVIPPAAQSVQLQLDVEKEVGYKSYRAELRTTEGNEIWSQDGLRARPTDSGRAVVLQLPARVFTTGEYELTLRGVTTEREFEDIGYYYFSVVKR